MIEKVIFSIFHYFHFFLVVVFQILLFDFQFQLLILLLLVNMFYTLLQIIAHFHLILFSNQLKQNILKYSYRTLNLYNNHLFWHEYVVVFLQKHSLFQSSIKNFCKLFIILVSSSVSVYLSSNE